MRIVQYSTTTSDDDRTAVPQIWFDFEFLLQDKASFQESKGFMACLFYNNRILDVAWTGQGMIVELRAIPRNRSCRHNTLHRPSGGVPYWLDPQ